MRPSRPYHAVSTQHREPCGLHSLDFFVDRILNHCDERDPSGYRVLALNCGKGDLPLALATMGFDVTGIDNSDANIRKMRETAQEMGLTIRCVTDGLQSMNGRFDAIILAQAPVDRVELMESLKLVKERLHEQGIILFGAPRRLGPYADLAGQWRKAGFWITNAQNASVFFRKIFDRLGRDHIKRGQDLFHFLDAMDDRLCGIWPRAWSDGWLLELRVAPTLPLVVQLIPTMGRGGAERIVMQLAERLPAQGFANLIVAFMQGGDLKKDCQVRQIPYIVMRREGWFKRWTNFWALRRLLADLGPAMVHTHLFGSDFWGRWAARWAGIKSIVTTEHNVSPDLGFLRTTILRAMRPCSMVYVAISSSVERYLTDKIRIPKEKVHLIYNGLDLKRIIPRPASSWHDIPRLVFVGRLEPQKNPELILRALAPIQYPWRLALVGVGSQQAALESLAQDLKIRSRVDFLGRREDVPEILAQSDIFLFPSRWEGFGLALAEAAAAGVPAIASDLPVLRELLSDEQASFVPATDVTAWTQAIRAALADPAPYVAKAQHAAAADWSRFSEERMIAQYAELYRRLIMKNVKRITNNE